MKDSQRIVVIDDEVGVGEFVSAAAQNLGFDCTATTAVKTFLENLAPDTTLILLDLLMPDMDGIELLRLLGERKCKAGIVLMSGVGKRTLESAEQLAQVLGLSIVGHLQKPFRLAELEEVLTTQAKFAILPTVQPGVPLITLNEELRSALERHEFVLHYQPIIEIATGRVTGVEALARWQHPKRGLIFPASFIGPLEKLGVIDEFGWIVANRGMSEVSQFVNDDGGAIMLSLNESVYSLHDLKFPEVFVSLAEEHGISPGNITIEITESGLIEELSRALDILTRLRMKQVKLSIDDFGTGYSMMQQLRNVPATEVKIDKSFVQGMTCNDRERVIVEKTIEIGHELGMQVVGEGIETEEQLEFLRQRGCDSAQGYLFSRPIPPEEMVGWLASYRAGQSSEQETCLRCQNDKSA